MAAAHRAGEGDEVDARIGDGALGGGVIGVEELEDSVGQAGRGECFGEALGAQRRLRRVLEEDRVAGQQRRYHRVDGDQVRVVPGRDDEHGAERHFLDEQLIARAAVHRDVGEPARGELDHAARSVGGSGDLPGREADRPPHLQRDLATEDLCASFQMIGEGGADAGALLEPRRRPEAPRFAGAGENMVDLVPNSEGAGGDDRTVAGRNNVEVVHAACILETTQSVDRRPVWSFTSRVSGFTVGGRTVPCRRGISSCRCRRGPRLVLCADCADRRGK
jgi:hypothetical protein